MRICFAFGDAWIFGDAPSSSDWHQASVLPSKATQPTKEASFLAKHFFLHWSRLDYLEWCKSHLMIIVCFANAYFDLKSKLPSHKCFPSLASAIPCLTGFLSCFVLTLMECTWSSDLEMQCKKMRTEPLGAENAIFTNLAREREAGVGSTECVQLSPSEQ